MIDGRYTLVRELGRGGMGAVWQAHDDVLGRDVAIKRLIGTEQTGVVARAWREARLAASLSHPHLVSVFDLVTDDQDLWLVMEYVDGPSLAQLVREQGPLSPAAAARILDDVAAGLEAAHEAGIVHRDVKPSNILVPADGPTKLGDFGIARGLDGEATLTMTDAVTGSPLYLSPEVASGGTAGPASDVWSLGATLFHMVTGRAPYDDGGSVLGVLYRIVHEPVPRTDRAGWLAPLLEGTMVHDPGARWSLAQVRAFLAAGPGVPPGPPPASVGTDTSERLPAAPTTTAVLPALREARPADAGTRPGRPRRRPWLAAIAALTAAVAVVVIAAVTLTHRGGNSSPDAGSSPDRGGAPSSSASQPSASGGAQSVRSSTPTIAGVRRFVRTYLATAPRDPAAGFAMLTARYRSASGGLAGYRSFWGEVTKIHSVRGVRATLDPLQATYTYTYTRRHVGTVTETVRLALQYVGGHYLIDGASTVRG